MAARVWPRSENRAHSHFSDVIEPRRPNLINIAPQPLRPDLEYRASPHCCRTRIRFFIYPFINASNEFLAVILCQPGQALAQSDSRSPNSLVTGWLAGRKLRSESLIAARSRFRECALVNIVNNLGAETCNS